MGLTHNKRSLPYQMERGQPVTGNTAKYQSMLFPANLLMSGLWKKGYTQESQRKGQKLNCFGKYQRTCIITDTRKYMHHMVLTSTFKKENRSREKNKINLVLDTSRFNKGDKKKREHSFITNAQPTLLTPSFK